MAEEQQVTGKAKKLKRDEERRNAGKKRKRHHEAKALPDTDDELEQEEAPLPPSQPSSKKRKVNDEDKAPDRTKVEEDKTDKDDAKSTKAKKKRKLDDAADDNETGENSKSPPKPKKQRFIVFVGNLPYTITTQGIQEHFAKIQPESVRHMTEPNSTKSKGYAFLEFANYDRMKTCLSLYHHTTIDSGIGGAKGVKKINVELTAGGGGKSANRQNKLKERNTRLQEQRQRRAEALAKEDKRKGRSSTKGEKPHHKAHGPVKSAVAQSAGGGEVEGIHPARLARINAG